MEVEKIYNEFHSVLLNYVKRKVRSVDDAKDILQNVFIRISSNIHTLSNDVKLTSWLFTITRNAITDYYRANSRNSNTRSVDAFHDSIPVLEDTDFSHGLDQCVSSMIKRLPDDYKDIIIETEINGISQKELAVKHGIAYPSLRSKVQRGRAKLKQLFHSCCKISTDVRGNVMDVRGSDACSGSCNPCPTKI